ncbi:FecR family protein [Chitinophaga niastensis]|nr:FecR family protein [Chitinophaga niastensis]
MTMNIDKEYLIQLVLFEISGNIGEDEKTYLHQVIAEDQEANAIYLELLNMYPENRLQEIRAYPGAEKVWIAIRKKEHYQTIVRYMTGMAALFVMAGFFSYIFFTKKKDSSPPIAEHIQLQLRNGPTIDLSNQQGRTQLGNIILNNKNKQLTYSYDTATPQSASLTVPAGKDYSIHLQDGSEIELNAATQLDFPLAFTGNTREVTIHGEAYLKIAQNAGKPFLVHLPGATVQVLGTAFNVNTYDSNAVSVALVEGAVKMEAGNATSILKPGYEISFTPEKGMSTEKFDEGDVLAWRQGIHLFHAASMEEIATLIHRFYGVVVKIDVKAANNKPFTGSMNRNKPVRHFLDGLKFSQYIDYYFDNDSILHLK